MTDPIEQPSDLSPEHRRTIKSFVMRAGRMTTGQERGLELGWPKFGLELENGPLDLDQLFGRQAPRTFEIGFGMGQATLEMAAAAPEQVAKQRKILNILCDHVDDVAPYLVDRMLASTKNGDAIAWLTTARMTRKFLIPG